jgi:hypothetical protein
LLLYERGDGTKRRRMRPKEEGQHTSPSYLERTSERERDTLND